MSGQETAPPPELRQLQQALGTASDTQLSLIVGMVDGLRTRQAADQLLDPVRGRLGRLGVRRPLQLGRLLFMPIEPLLVPARDWRRRGPGVPRTALAPLARQAEGGLSPQAAQINALLRGSTTDQDDLVQRIGSLLWPTAAAVLRRTPSPPDWQEATGLTEIDHAAITARVAAVLSEAVWLGATRRRIDEGESVGEADFRAWLDAAATRSAAAPEALLVVLLTRFPQAAGALGALPPRFQSGGGTVEVAIDFLLERIAADAAAGQDMTETCHTLLLAAALLEELLAPGPGRRPSRKGQVEQLRRKLARDCRDHYVDTLSRTLLAPLVQGADRAAIAGLEPTARDLRRLEIAGRRLGSTDSYDRLVQEAVQRIGRGERQTAVERARLIEILAGPEAALGCLRA